MILYLSKITHKNKFLLKSLYDFFVCSISLPVSFQLRYGDSSFINDPNIILIFTIAFIVKLTLLLTYKLNRTIWTFTSSRDLLLITKISSYSTIISFSIFFFIFRLQNVPRTSAIIDLLIFSILLSAGRLIYRLLLDENLRHNNGSEKTLIVGAGRACEQLLRELSHNKKHDFKLVGILDDDASKQNRLIHGLPIIGKINDLQSICTSLDIKKVIIAIPSANSTFIRSVYNKLVGTDVKVITLPSMTDIADDKVQISQLRPIKVEDLLRREPINLSSSEIDTMIKNKVILITGAGGSIGSDLCEQISKRSPRQVLLFEQCEFFLYELDLSLRSSFPDLDFIPIIGDVRDLSKVLNIFEKYKPDIIFHAAAYKHVPMMEINSQEAIKTNIIGTLNMAKASVQYPPERFVLISTDKAVRPTNVMGATKRIAEMILENYQSKNNQTKYSAVRFGNVLASKGSVVPLFLKQIEKGGPVTVTHPEITRYFMSIPEATQLVLQASSMAMGGEIFVLDMGSPVKILDLAKDVITLTGFIPDKDIKIEYTGLRPAEKLYEELFFSDEDSIRTHHSLIRKAKIKPGEPNISNLVDIDFSTFSEDDIKKFLQKIVPEYLPYEKNF